MRRLHYTVLSVVLFPITSSVSTLAAAQEKTNDRPNIIVILADDLGWYDVGHEEVRIDTPHLDKLMTQGTRLTQFYASASICSPTRAALLTGRYPHSVGMPELANTNNRDGHPPRALDHDAITIPEALKPCGYTSALIGKWHLGFLPGNWPRTHGFDEFWGSLLVTPGYYAAQDTYHNETPIKVTGYFTDQITDHAIDFVERNQKQPFFLYLAYNAPHYPLEAPFELVKKYRSPKRFYDDGLFAIYAAMVEQGGLKVPFVVRNPYEPSRGIISEAMISHVDITPKRRLLNTSIARNSNSMILPWTLQSRRIWQATLTFQRFFQSINTS